MKILITGASGFLGWNLCRYARQFGEVWGVAHSHPVEVSGVNMLCGDLCEPGFINRTLDGGFDAVIHLAAQADLSVCERKPQESRKINVDASAMLAQEAFNRGAKFVFTSTDIVFGGTGAPYYETDTPDPINEYGRQKAEAEREIFSVNSGACVCRMPLMFGPPCPIKPSFLQPMLQAMREGKELKLFEDEYRTPLGASSACEGLMLAVEKGEGIWHLGGPQRISRYDFGMLVADYFGITNAKIIRVRQVDVQLSAARPADVSLENTQSKQAGFNPRQIVEELSLI